MPMPTMKYIIDACNLIFHDRVIEETLEHRGFPAVRALVVSILSRFAHAERLDEIVAVFDGSEKAAHRPRNEVSSDGRVRLIFANPRDQADREIIELVQDARARGQITVVTNDKFILREVTSAGARTQNSGAFLKRIRRSVRHAQDPLRGEDPRKYHGVSPREVDEWMKIFGFDERLD
jgi:predicted RNA-binding protein with PIN domain